MFTDSLIILRQSDCVIKSARDLLGRPGCWSGRVNKTDQIPDAGVALISLVIPVFNEADSLKRLLDEITSVMATLDTSFEVIFINDGSSDASEGVLDDLCDASMTVRVIEFRRNFGKAAALDAGFRAAQGDVIFTLDADLQDDPAEIPKFLAVLANGSDVVSGWKKQRHDPLGKTLPSKIFNSVVSRMSGVKLNDFNCGFKAYRREALEGLNLYGELHRFIPVLLHWRGFKVDEIVVNHRAREFGQSKFGTERLVKGALDLLTVILNTRFQTRPLHIFGGGGLLMGMAGFLILAYLTIVWFAGGGPIGNRPMLFLGILLVLSSLQFFTVGLLGEFIQRQATNGQPAYVIRRARNLENLEEQLNPEIQRLNEAASALKKAEEKWSQPPSEMTPAPAMSTNTKIKTHSTG